GFMIRTAALHLARAAMEAGRRAEAGELVKVALMLYPWSADALALQGVLALTSGMPAEAEQRLRRAIALLPGQPTFHAAFSVALLPRCSTSRQAALRFRLGELLIAQGQVERAREHFRGVEALDPQGHYSTAAWRAAQL